ncbi:MAG TPA: autotransporter-associated beta strand repeat-containing protein [Paludibacteraceae bacterium]|nr:autotransporter-associated beta strand repeat-containing protein [Paludibacteraceae bacterium]
MKTLGLKKSLVLFLLIITGVLQSGVYAQRVMEKLDRGVVAVKNSSGGYLVSWRYLATDPEDILFNLYARVSGGSGYVKLNASPLTATNYSAASGAIGVNTQLYVTPVINGVEGTQSGIFKIPYTGFPATYRSAYIDINYSPLADGLDLYKYSTKFIWPADLDGDGEYDFVVDRLSVDGGTHKIQGYLRNGQYLWTVDMGPNVSISQGQDDMVIAYDMDSDGKADVVIKSSDGTKFADGKGVNGSTTLDTDNDGIIDYNSQNVKNPPQYITVIDGMTGKEKNSIEMKYPSNYTRTNKAIFMGTEYANLNGMMAIIYIDGKHPSVGFVYKTRTSSDKYHWYYASAYGYNASGQWVNWYNWERGYVGAAEFHSIRSADVDLDGRDELLNGGYGIKYDGTLAFNANISHGDRFRTGDIDPDRPGLETFAIQQNNPTMLGQLIYDAGTGEAIKKIYMSAVGDVGRGECMDVDSTRLGYEFWSTMANIYDAKGNILYEGGTPFPHEGIWWDGELDREELSSADGNGFNAHVGKYSVSSHSFGNRLIEFAKMTGWQVNSEYGVRPAFFGDIIGDWREEVLLEKKGSQVVGDSTYTTNTGFVGFSTDYPTTKRIYCLMQNPAYRDQATTKGYYQSPIPDFYLGYNMPVPPVPPVQKAKLTWSSGTAFDKSSTSFLQQDEITRTAFVDGDDVMFDISGDNSAPVQLTTDLAPSKIWAMNPKGKDYVLGGTGKLTGTMELVKSQNGKFTLNGNHTYTGKTIISEGNLCLNGSNNSPIDVRAKGTLSGNAVLNGGIVLNPGLNVEGGRLSPGNGLEAGKLGKIVINGALTLPGKSNIEIDIIPEDPYKNDSLVINGNFTANGINTIIVNGTLTPGTYTLVAWTGTLKGTLANFDVTGVAGLPVRLVINSHDLQLVVGATRSASGVTWTGSTDANWDYMTTNFQTITLPHQSTFFVQNDSVLFDDSAVQTNVSLSESMITKDVQFANNTKSYTFTGTGGIGGSGNFQKSGKGLLDLGNIQSTFTGKTIYNNAQVKVSALNQTSMPGPLGQAATAPANWVMTDTRLIVDAVESNTDRGLTIQGTDTIEIPKSNGVVSITGTITGTGGLVKSGAGQLNVSSSSPNTYTGETVIKAGTIGLGTLEMNRTGFGKSGKIRMENGSRIRMFDNNSDYNQKATWYITIPEGSTARIDASSRCDINGSISGAGTLNYYVPYVRADLVAGGGNNFTGTINVTGRDFRITTNAATFPKAAINLGANVFMGAYSTIGSSSTNASTVVKIGSLAGDATSSVGGGTWQIGTDNRDAIFRGVFGSGATVTKSGTGKWTLTNASTLTSTFSVTDGTLVVQNTTGSATGTGNLSMSGSAILAGTGIIGGNANISNSAKVMPGNNETALGTLTFSKNLSLTVGSTVVMKTISTANDQLKVDGTLYLNGNLELRNLSGNWTAGKSYTLFVAPTISGSFTSITPAIPGKDLIWDLTRLNQGIIAVINDPTPVNEINASSVSVYPAVMDKYCLINLGNITGKVQIDLYGVNGVKKLSYTESGYNSLVRMNVSHLQPGAYFLRLTNSGSTATYKLIKK